MTERWDQILGYAMTAYYGGRAECRIRRVAVPVVTVDFTSMYATVQTLMGLERFLTCSRIDARIADVGRLTRWLKGLEIEDLFDPSTWQRLPVICLVEPRPGDVFPIRARYGGPQRPFGIGVNVWAETPSEPLWYTLPDVIASRVLSGQVPKILRAIRFVHVGRAPGVRPIALRGEAEVDPRDGRFFASIVERRAALHQAERKVGLGRFLKVLASSTAYGIFAEMNRHERADGKVVPIQVHGLLSFEDTAVPETPGAYFFAPTAALVTGAARLMLALLEHEVTARGGCYACCDTDSMAIVATRRRRFLRIEGAGAEGVTAPRRLRELSWADVRRIVERFDRLNPYVTIDHLLRIEDENFEYELQHELRCFPGGLVAFEGLNDGKEADEQVRPFNFLLVCFPDRLLLSEALDPARFRLVAPYERNSSKWVRMGWFEAHGGGAFRITTVVEGYRVHEEAKSTGPDGERCGMNTRGLLGRRGVVMRGKPRHVGKESNKLEDRLTDQVGLEEEYMNVLGPDEWSDFRQVVVPAAIEIGGIAAIARGAEVSESASCGRLLRGRRSNATPKWRSIARWGDSAIEKRTTPRQLGGGPPCLERRPPPSSCCSGSANCTSELDIATVPTRTTSSSRRTTPRSGKG